MCRQQAEAEKLYNLAMSRHLRHGLLFATLTGLAFLTCRTEPERPVNLLILSVDTLRADAIGAAGYAAAHTPHIDRLAAEGTYFTAAVTPMPRTTPALGSLLSGLWPHHHGSREVGDPILDVPTLAEILRDRGYVTLAVSANLTAGPRQQLHRGFAEFVTYEDLISTYGDGLYRDLTDIAPDNDGWATAVTREGLRLADRLAGQASEPWFLWLFYFDPHLMYRPPAPWQDVEAQRCWELYEHYQEHRDEAGQVFADLGGVATRALEDCRRLYDAEVAYVDHEIGRLLETLEASERLDDTLVVFAADHGENFGEGGLFFEHGDNAHDAGLRVPLVFAGPGVARGRRDAGAVSLVDVVPTVLSLLGVELEAPADGIDLAARLRAAEEPGPATRSRVVFAESATSMWNESVDMLLTGRLCCRVCINGERFTLCEIPRDEPSAYQLYDHVADPKLTTDVAAEHQDVVERLAKAWERWPPESARQRTARTSRFKLVQYPRLEGGYASKLHDLENDPQETVDVSSEYPRIYRHLLAELESWGAGIPVAPEREYDPELEEILRSLGYAK